MFSLWVCPDCEVVGRRVGVGPGGASPAYACGSTSRKAPHPPTPIAISEWVCQKCGQTGRLVEHRSEAPMEARRYPVEREPTDPVEMMFLVMGGALVASWFHFVLTIL